MRGATNRRDKKEPLIAGKGYIEVRKREREIGRDNGQNGLSIWKCK